MKSQCNAGNYSDLDVEGYINYYGDIDLLGYNIDKTGKGVITLFTYVKPVVAEAYSVGDGNGGFDELWFEGDVTSGTTSIECGTTRMYISIKQLKNTLPTYSDADKGYFNDINYYYKFGFYPPTRKDNADLAGHSVYGNNNPIYATELSNILTDMEYDENFTLHKGDTDFFTFTTGNYDTSIKLTVSQLNLNGYLYNVNLYDADEVTIISETPPEWRMGNTVAEATLSANGKNNKIEYNHLKPNHKYYIRVSRPNSNSYSSYYEYGLWVVLTKNTYTATLKNDVALTHTNGTNISSLDDMLNTVMNSMTCKLNNNVVSNTTAINDVKLYYNNSELTTDIVNSLTAGTYSLTAKYMDTAATGGNITLTVAAPIVPQDDIVTVQLTDPEPALMDELDWISTAKMIANIRLRREGKEINSEDTIDAATNFGWEDFETRGDITATKNMATYFYTYGALKTGNTFINGTVTANTAETTLYNTIKQGKAVIMQMVVVGNETDMSQARYLLLLGVNKTEHKLKVYDPISDTEAWYDSNIMLNGGYGENSNLKFSKRIIEGSSYTG